MKSLVELVELYKRNNLRDEDWKMSEFTKSKKPIKELIGAAVEGRQPKKNDPHQSRISKETKKEMTRKLMDISNIELLNNCRHFDEVFTIVYKSKEPGFGPLAVYDTSLRLGARMDLLPEVVYLHTGALEGVKRLLGYKVFKGQVKYFCENKDYPYISKKLLPEELKVLEAYHIENFLCIFRDRWTSGKTHTM